MIFPSVRLVRKLTYPTEGRQFANRAHPMRKNADFGPNGVLQVALKIIWLYNGSVV